MVQPNTLALLVGKYCKYRLTLKGIGNGIEIKKQTVHTSIHTSTATLILSKLKSRVFITYVPSNLVIMPGFEPTSQERTRTSTLPGNRT